MASQTVHAAAQPTRQALPEHARVRLRQDDPASGLQAGSAGTVVHVYRDHAAYEVEFTEGHNPPVLATLLPADMEPLTDQDG